MRLSSTRVSASAAVCIAIATAVLLASSPREFDRAIRMARGGAHRLDAAESVHGNDAERSEQPSVSITLATGPPQVLDHAASKAPADLACAVFFVPALDGLPSPLPASSHRLGRPAVAATGRAPPLA